MTQQKTELCNELAKEKAKFQLQMAQQASAQKVQAPASQTVKPVRQPRGLPSLLKTEEGMKNYYVAKFLKDLDLVSKEDLDSDYPVKPFQKPFSRKSNISTIK